MKNIAITIIDDDSTARSLLSSILRVEGYTNVQAFPDGHAALQTLDGIRSGLIFLDIEMPREDGFTLLSRIKEACPECFVIMVSAHTSIDNVKKAMELGASSFIAKPYRIGKVHDAMARYQSPSNE